MKATPKRKSVRGIRSLKSVKGESALLADAEQIGVSVGRQVAAARWETMTEQRREKFIGAVRDGLGERYANEPAWESSTGDSGRRAADYLVYQIEEAAKLELSLDRSLVEAFCRGAHEGFWQYLSERVEG